MWTILAWLTALFEASKDLAAKKILANLHEYQVGWLLHFFGMLAIIPVWLLTDPSMPESTFWLALLIGGSLNIGATLLYMKALKNSDLSVCLPMLSFTPAFLLITSPIMLGEQASIVGMLGVLLITAGSYLLNIKSRQYGWLSPIKALVTTPDARLMLGVALIWSITSNIDKMGIMASSPITWVFSIKLFLSITLLPFALKDHKSFRPAMSSLKWYWILLPGLFSAIALICQMTAISITQVAYVIAIKRCSTVFGSLGGLLFFKEPEGLVRLPAALIMLAGAVIITLS